MKPLVGCLSVLFLISSAAHGQAPAGAKLQGSVRDARGGEALAKVAVVLEGTSYRGISDLHGQFEIAEVMPGDYVLRVSTVGYKLELIRLSLAAGEVKEFDVALLPDTLGLTTTVEVKAGPFSAARIESPSEMNLSGNDAKNLASVLVDDPLRAVQAMPGITSNDDFSSRLSLRAADYPRIGLYLDGVQLHQPYDMIQSEGAAVTVTAIDGDMLDGIDVQTGVFPSQYGDATAAAIDMQTREGSQVKPSVRITASAANAGALAEGPLGKQHGGDWIFNVRKSYLQYIIEHTSPEMAPYAFGLFDYQGRVTYNLGDKSKLSLAFVDGHSGLDRSDDAGTLAINDLKKSRYHYTVGNLGWNFTPTARFLASSHLAWMREALAAENKVDTSLDRGQYSEWVWNSDATWMWHSQDALNFGWSMRQIRDVGSALIFQYVLRGPTQMADDYRGSALHAGGYGEQVWKFAQGRVALTTGLRWDRYGLDRVQTVLPQATLAIVPWQSTHLSFGFGQYAQGPDPDWAFSLLGGSRLLPERSNSFVAAVEQRLNERTRLRVEVYERRDRDLLFRSFFEPRLVGGQIYSPPDNPPIENALNGHARGMQIFLQRRSANHLTGWVSYSLGFSRLHDREAAISFPSDQDQRHSVNLYLSYRLRPTVNISIRSIYGSGMPLPGFYCQKQGAYYLSDARNALYHNAYQRTDARVNKAWAFDRWKLTLYAEALNVFDRQNLRYDNLDGYDPKTGQASLEFMDMLPIVPSVGLVWEF